MSELILTAVHPQAESTRELETLMTQTVLITGASSGMAEALAIELAARGYDLGLTARRLDALEQLSQEIRQRYPDRQIELRRLDVTHYDEVPKVIDDLARALDGLDVVVANAGIAGSGPIGHGHADADRSIVETNLLGAMATMDAAVALFHREQGREHIVAILSVAGFRGLPGSAAYSASRPRLQCSWTLYELSCMELRSKSPHCLPAT